MKLRKKNLRMNLNLIRRKMQNQNLKITKMNLKREMRMILKKKMRTTLKKKMEMPTMTRTMK